MGGSRGAPGRELGPWRRRLEAVGISLLGAVVMWVGARFEATGPLVGVGFTLVLVPSLVERWRAPLWGFVPGAMLYATVINVTLAQFAWYAPLLVVPLLGWHYVLMPLLTRSLAVVTRGPAWFVLPLALGAEEWIRPHLGLGNYSMYKTGTFLYQWPVLIQVAEVIGALGLTVLYAVVLGAGVEWLRLLFDGSVSTSRRRVLVGGVLATAIVVSVSGYGVWRLETLEKLPGPRLALVQPSQDHGFDLTPRVVQVQQSMTATMIPAGAVDMLVWPENAILTPYELSQTYQDVVSWLVRTKGAPLLFGTQAMDRDGRPAALALLADEQGEVVGRYRKMVLFPFTERRILPWLESVLPAVSNAIVDLTRKAWGSAADGRAGESVDLISLEAAGERWLFWTPLCYDSCFADYARQAAAQGARFFVNLTSEGWNGWGIAHNQMAANVLRAVENRVGVARVGNTGVSCFIGPDGRAEQFLVGRKGRLYLDQGVLIERVNVAAGGPTFYTRWGSVLDPFWPLAWLLATVTGLVLRFARRRRKLVESPVL